MRTSDKTLNSISRTRLTDNDKSSRRSSKSMIKKVLKLSKMNLKSGNLDLAHTTLNKDSKMLSNKLSNKKNKLKTG